MMRIVVNDEVLVNDEGTTLHSLLHFSSHY